MERRDYYSDRKFCGQCAGYVPYLMSVDRSYCAQCGSEVRLFSESDWTQFHQAIQEKRPKGGRPRNKKKESA
jgi:hypothetical protein